MEKSKVERSPWVKKTKKTGPKKNERDKKKMCCNAILFPGNHDLLSETLRGPVLPLVCGFIRSHNLSRHGAGCLRTFTS